MLCLWARLELREAYARVSVDARRAPPIDPYAANQQETLRKKKHFGSPTERQAGLFFTYAPHLLICIWLSFNPESTLKYKIFKTSLQTCTLFVRRPRTCNGLDYTIY